MVGMPPNPLWLIAIASGGTVQSLAWLANFIQLYVECADNRNSGDVLNPHL